MSALGAEVTVKNVNFGAEAKVSNRPKVAGVVPGGQVIFGHKLTTEILTNGILLHNKKNAGSNSNRRQG